MNSVFSFSKSLLDLAEKAEAAAEPSFARIDRISKLHEESVLSAFIRHGVGESHLHSTTGYGYGDRGREALDLIFADVFGAEDALVRHSFASGTHALTVALFGVLRPGDKMVALTGAPYDTMEGVIGIRSDGSGSLKDFGVEYSEVPLKEDGTPNLPEIKIAVKGVKVAYIQRSRGYSLRPSLSVAEIGSIVAAVREVSPDTCVMVDNCYGEFVEETEPTAVGADLIIGSLIKNAGGGIAQTGGYIAGKRKYVEMCADRLYFPGGGKEVGCTLGQNRPMLMGLFFAPSVVGSALKTSVFALSLFTMLGFDCYPAFDAHRTDIIAAIALGDSEKLCSFCRGIQKGSPVDSFATPEPWDMPGYESPVIMAAGAFTMGASIELSADAPLREPYAVWLQGGLTYQTGRLGILSAAQNLIDDGLLKL